ncbi:hypothetical protein [Roseimicrobium sp. ORNL1]|uniref:hypothetical protein n=1 Tax=Roseimicrobium sp. ORNL1 TaxID=2711231 RepID=UPI0013E18213|nr:hypothetical protein [Roseimicrobium sp. ORNL1]QIF04933.1 hypothetical protein G5S37_26595 [Roseimicrobium sp. ORNL1]
MNRRTLLSSLACLLLIPSCKDMTQGKGLADTAIVDFHKKFNEQKFKDIYAGSHADLKAAAKEEEFLNLLDAVHRKLGKQVKSTDATWRVNSFNFKTNVMVAQNTEFERGKGTETFTYRVSDGKAILVSYYINSSDMMLK